MSFFLVAVGFPLTILAVAMLGGHFYRGSDAEVLDWKPIRSEATEAKLELSDIDQMLTAQNELRRLRGAPARSLAQATGHPWASLDAQKGEDC
jgi:hypothetical protein